MTDTRLGRMIQAAVRRTNGSEDGAKRGGQRRGGDKAGEGRRCRGPASAAAAGLEEGGVRARVLEVSVAVLMDDMWSRKKARTQV